jgi:hypothetical protein
LRRAMLYNSFVTEAMAEKLAEAVPGDAAW